MSGEALASAASDETIDAATVERMALEMTRAMQGGDLDSPSWSAAATSGEARRGRAAAWTAPRRTPWACSAP